MKKTSTVILATLFLALFAGSTVFAASSMAMRGNITLEKTPNKSYENSWANYNMGVCINGKTRLTRNMKMDGTIYIEKKLLSKGNVIGVGCNLNLQNLNKQDSWAGNVESMDNFTLINDDGRIVVLRNHGYNKDFWKAAPVGSMLKVTETGKYYVVKLNKVPLNAFYKDKDDKKTEFDSKNTTVEANFSLYVGDDGNTILKKVSGYVYLDDVTVYAEKTLKCDFEKDTSYHWVYMGYDKGNHNKEIRVSVVNMTD